MKNENLTHEEFQTKTLQLLKEISESNKRIEKSIDEMDAELTKHINDVNLTLMHIYSIEA